MTILSDADLQSVQERLHRGYIRALASEIRAKVGRMGRPLAVAYEPGDGTSYALVLTPLDRSPVTELATVRRGWEARGEDPAEVVGEPGGVETRLGIGAKPDGRFALVALINHGAYPFELFSGGHRQRPSGAAFDPGYVGDKLGISSAASAVAVTALLTEIAKPS